MKKLLLLTLFLSALFVACTDNEELKVGETYEGSTITRFLTVNITEPGNTGTRGPFDELEEGLKTESDVRYARFYFFDEADNSVKVMNSNGSFVDYIEWNYSSESDKEGENEIVSMEGNLHTEKKLIAHLKITSLSGEKIPSSVIVLLNYTETNIIENKNIKNLKSITGNFEISDENSLFVMSNSVYADKNSGKLYDAVEIGKYLSRSEEEADSNPAEVTVERANAKIRLLIGTELSNKEGNITLPDGTILYNIDFENSAVSPGEEGGNKVYVKFLGWTVTSAPIKSYLIKNIDPEWSNTQVFGSEAYDWTSLTNRRSYWAINPELSFANDNSKDYRFSNFDNIQKIKGFGADNQLNYTYTNENASEESKKPTSHPTQVIMAACLVNSKGEPWEITQWGGTYYVKEDLLKNLADMANIYEKREEENIVSYDKLDENYFKFVSASEAGKTSSDGGNYYAYIQINPETIKEKKLVWGAYGEEMDVNSINKRLAEELIPAKIWTDGNTYFYFDIEHLQINVNNGQTVTTLGVVRNHIYEATIVSLTKLGTPVFNKDEIIVPEIPDDDESFIYAKINIINWRLASKTIQLEW